MRLGNFKQAKLLAFFLIFSSQAGSQSGISFKYRSDGDFHAARVIKEDQSLIIHYSYNELNIRSLIDENGTFYKVEIPGHTPSTKTGEPELPVLSSLINIPGGNSYKVKITDVKSTRINPAKNKIGGILYPAQEGETKVSPQKKPAFKINKQIYSADEFLRSDTVKIEPLGILRNRHLANLIISPVSYNPSANTLEVITSMNIKITFNDAILPATKSLPPETDGLTASMLKGVLNYDPESMVPGYTDEPVKMIILTDTSYRKQIEPLVRWKTQKGFRVKVLYKGASFAGDNYNDIKTSIASIYNSTPSGEPYPEYLLIVGDVTKIPYFGTGNITDMYYGEFDGEGDYIPEMLIGRIPATDTVQVKNVVRKILQYETFQFADTNRFYSNALVTAGYDASYANHMNGQVAYLVTNYLTPANKIKNFHLNYPQSYTAKDSIIKLINKGISLINYTGHGEASGWMHIHNLNDSPSNYGIKSADINSFTNKNMYPLVISNACKTSQFNLASSFGNSLVVSADKGAIGFIGCSNDSYWNEDFYWAVGNGTPSIGATYENTGPGAFDRLFHTHNEAPSYWHYTLGRINYAGNLAVSASTSSYKKYYWETYNLVGDPSMIPYIGTPDTFNLVLPDTLPNNMKSYSFISEPFSYVAVSNFDTLFDASFASPSGSVTLDLPGLVNDSCLVVITGQNRIPLIKTIYFSEVNYEYINLDSSGINDKAENNNGLADFGETFFLVLNISNKGLWDAENLYAKISSSSEWATINTDSVKIGNLAGLSEIILDNDLSLTVNENIPDGGIITLDLLLKSDLEEKHYKIDIEVHAPKLSIISVSVDDSETGNGDQIADPGETFRLIFRVRNQGSSGTSGLFRLSSQDSWIGILEPSKTSGILLPETTNEIAVLVKLSDEVNSGTTITLQTALDCNPYFVNREFSFRVGRIRESFESSTFRVFPWINISPKPWIITGSSGPDGIVAARSGAIGHNQSSSLVMRTRYSLADSIRFYYKVSSELNYDLFIFKINDKEVFRKSGEVAWAKATIYVPEGYNKLEWIYRKDQSVSSGMDNAVIDMIDFAGEGSVGYIWKDMLTARIVSPLQEDNPGKEPVTVKVINTGPDTISGFNLAYRINNGFPVIQHFNDKIVPYGDSISVTFNSYANLSRYGFYDLVVYGFDNDDDYLFNDTLRLNIENTNIDEPLVIFPNPFNEELNILINSEYAGTAEISLISSTGKKLIHFEHAVETGENNILLKGNSLPSSVYILRIEFRDKVKVFPVVKIRN